MDAIRPYLLPYTHYIPGPIKSAGETLIGPVCYRTLIEDLAPTQPCVSLAISKGLGVGIIGAASIVKIPQILSLLNTKSAKGLSLTSNLLEVASYGISLAYNIRSGFPISTFGEVGLILIQNVVIALLILSYTGKPSSYLAGLVGAISVAAGALSDSRIINSDALRVLQAGAGLLSIASKLPQIYTVYQAGSTGVLSAFAVFNYLAGSASRIYTTLAEVPDQIILYSFIAGFVLNLVLAIQMVYYWNSPGSAHGESKKAVKKGASKAKKEIESAKRKTPRAPRTKDVDNLSASFTDSGSETPGGTRRSTRRRG
jgi:mannose-P-dolichol utilization defect protein 1